MTGRGRFVGAIETGWQESSAGGRPFVTDGPFLETKELISVAFAVLIPFAHAGPAGLPIAALGGHDRQAARVAAAAGSVLDAGSRPRMADVRLTGSHCLESWTDAPDTSCVALPRTDRSW